MRVQDVMTKDVQTIAPTNAAEDAWELMRRHGFHHVVVTRGSHVVGILSDRDAGGRQGTSVRKGRTVEELMTTHVVTDLLELPRPRKRPASNNRHAVDAQAPHAASETRDSDRHVVKGRATYSTGEQP